MTTATLEPQTLTQADLNVTATPASLPLANEVRFTDFNISDSLKNRLSNAGFSIPTPVQAKAIPPALEGADILATQGAVTLERDQFDTAALLLNVEPPPSFLNIPGPTITMRDSSISAPIRLSHGHALFDFKENWWGTPAGPQSGWYTAGYDPYEDVSAETYVEPWLTSDPFGDTSDPCANGCASSVLFLPGIEGIAFHYFNETDVVRHRLVRDIVKAYAADATGE